jgi:hypothetical protein
MNATRNLTPLTLIAATLAAAFLVQGARAATPVVQLEPVQVTAHRVPAGRAVVVQLPRVEVTALRARVVQLPAVEVSARRADAPNLLAQQRAAATSTRKPV